MIDDKGWFRFSKNRYMQIQIILNILCQFFAHTSPTVIINKHVNYMSVGFLIVELLAMIDDKDWFRFSKNNQANRYNISDLSRRRIGQALMERAKSQDHLLNGLPDYS